MSTANKLSYLNDTKSLLRTSLNKFGSSILSTDTFRSYDTKLNDIYNKLPKVTQSGAGFTLLDVQNGQVDDFKMNGVDLEQDTTTGKNLWGGFQNSFSKTNADIDFVTNKDGTITANGTANGTAYSMYGSEATNNGFLKTLSPGNYVISGATPEIAINVVKYDGTGISTTGSNLIATFTLSEETQLFVRLQIYNKTVNNVTIKPMLESGTTATNYEPYTGGIPSPNPDYPQEIKVVEGRQVITDKGKNLLKLREISGTNNGITISYDEATQVYTFNGTCTQDNTTFPLSNNEINFTNGITKSITYWVNGSCSGYCSIRHYDSSYSSSCTYSILNISSTNNKIEKTSNASFVCPVRMTSIKFNNNSVANNLQIKIMVTDDENTDYEPYYEPVEYNIDLNLENIYLAKMPDTNYKNRIYKNNGNWYFEENVKKVVLDGSENWVKLSYSFYFSGDMFSNKPVSICSHFIDNGSTWTSSDENLRGKYTTKNATQFKCMPLEDMTLNEFKTWLSTHNVIVWYPLATSVTTQITNTTLINQLEVISVHTGTNIITISNSNNIIPEIEITRLKELEKLS